MTDLEIVLRKLTTLREHLQRARRRRPDALASLASDEDLQDALFMSLLVAIQEAIDIAFHIAAGEGWGVADSSAQSFELLARNGVLSSDLAGEMGSGAALRNRIAHGYASLDLPRLWAELPTGLDAMDRYTSAIADWLARSQPA
jgi:uncharacterized protein YutE (UPF0331/DUF86 family)